MRASGLAGRRLSRRTPMEHAVNVPYELLRALQLEDGMVSLQRLATLEYWELTMVEQDKATQWNVSRNSHS